MKEFLKSILGNLYCFIFRIQKEGKIVYTGRRIKFIGGKRIKLGNKAIITSDNFICAHENGTIEIGEGTRIGPFSRIAAENEVKIGKFVITGPSVFIADYNHQYEDINKPIKHQGKASKTNGIKNKVSIGDGAWLGTHAVIVGNVKIGKNSVVGANSVVTKDVPDYCVAVGAPAKIIKKYDIDKKEWIRVKANKNNNG